MNESRIILDDKSRQFIAFNGGDKGWIVFIAHQCSYIVHHRVYDNLVSTNNGSLCLPIDNVANNCNKINSINLPSNSIAILFFQGLTRRISGVFFLCVSG